MFLLSQTIENVIITSAHMNVNITDIIPVCSLLKLFFLCAWLYLSA